MVKHWITLLKYSVRFMLALYVAIEGSLSLAKYLQGKSTDTTKLTFVEAKHNEQFQHPLYTICPIFNYSSSDLASFNKTFFNLLIENTVYVPTVTYISALNSPELDVIRSTSWIKTFINVKRKEETLVQCHTFEVANNVTPGQSLGQVIFPTNAITDIDFMVPHLFCRLTFNCYLRN